MRAMRAEKVLTGCALGAAESMTAVILLPGKVGWFCRRVCFLGGYVWFATKIGLALRKVGGLKNWASSFLIMSIVGGAVAPILMVYIADSSSMATGFIIPLSCFVVIAIYAARYGNIQKTNKI